MCIGTSNSSCVYSSLLAKRFNLFQSPLLPSPQYHGFGFGREYRFGMTTSPTLNAWANLLEIQIITYIGVPLAVLGVLPIIYNTISTLVTLANVRRALRHGRLAGITRGDVINHIIEVELPRYTLAPLHREHQIKEYWGLCEHPSHIKGGSWTIFK